MDTKHCQYVDNYLFTWSRLHDFDVKKQLRYTQHNKVPWPTVSIIRPSQQAVWRWVRKLFCLGRGRIKNCMKTNCSQERNFTKKQTFESDKRKYVFRTTGTFLGKTLFDAAIVHPRKYCPTFFFYSPLCPSCQNRWPHRALNVHKDDDMSQADGEAVGVGSVADSDREHFDRIRINILRSDIYSIHFTYKFVFRI